MTFWGICAGQRKTWCVWGSRKSNLVVSSSRKWTYAGLRVAPSGLRTVEKDITFNGEISVWTSEKSPSYWGLQTSEEWFKFYTGFSGIWVLRAVLAVAFQKLWEDSYSCAVIYCGRVLEATSKEWGSSGIINSVWWWAVGMEGDWQTLDFCCSRAHDSFVNRWQMKVPKSKVRLCGRWIQEETRVGERSQLLPTRIHDNCQTTHFLNT